MTKEQLFKEFQFRGARTVDCDEVIVKKYSDEIAELLFYKKVTENLFYIIIKNDIKNISIMSLNEEIIDLTFDKKKILAYADQDWLMVVEVSKKRLYLYKI